MFITSHSLPLAAIQIDRDKRQRRELKVEDLAKSIARNGLIQPIIVEQREAKAVGEEPAYWLLAGERRLEACRQLGWPSVPVRFAEELSATERQIIEYEENIKRRDLNWIEIIRSAERIHQLLGLRPEWSEAKTADELGISKGHLNEMLTVAKALDEPRIAACGNIREAWNILARRKQREMGDELEEMLGVGQEILKPRLPARPVADGVEGPAEELPEAELPPEALPCITQGDFLAWAPAYSGSKFSLIHCDFPYGVNLFDGKQGRGAEPSEGFEDTPDKYFELLECLVTNLPRLMSVSGHLMFWYSEKHIARTKELFARTDLRFSPYPLVWLKSDNAGISGDPRRHPRHVYETCLLGIRGGRHLTQVLADGYASPTDRAGHASSKPEPMLRHFMGMLVDSGTSVLDPTCGGGSALRAAESLGAFSLRGLELDGQVAQRAEQSLVNARNLRRLTR